MAVVITDVTKNSIAHRHGIMSGHTLLKINGFDIIDVLDYQFYLSESLIELELIDSSGKNYTVKFKKGQYDDIGLCFETYLMDSHRSCRNKCIFCFIDQLPQGLRESLYFKDDDSRLSFLFGNYITLTNLSEHEVSRIIKMHIPVNISVHTTNPELRCKMMNNRFAGDALDILKRFAQNGIKINCQLVLCPGYNDGEELKRSFDDLLSLVPSVQSIALAPVGLTKYRDGLAELTPFTKETAGAVIDIAESYGKMCIEKFGERIIYPGDEFYLKAERELPGDEFYGEYLQLENGVGLVTLLNTEFGRAMQMAPDQIADRTVTIATGVAAYPIIKNIVDLCIDKWHNLKCTVIGINNDFFGEKITVAGLVTGRDLIKNLKDKPLGDELLFPAVMLRSEGDIFLDDVSVEDVESELNIKARPIANDGFELLEAIIGQSL